MGKVSGSSVQKPPVEKSPHELRNRGPWTTVEYTPWTNFSIGHTTALGDGAGVRFNGGSLTELLTTFLPGDQYYMAQQVHETDVCSVDGGSKCYVGSDGLVSLDPGQLMFIRTADCMPVYIRPASEPSPQCPYGIVHAGWRGLLAGIVPSAIRDYFEGPVELFVGPHIGVDQYEVGDEVINGIRETFGIDRETMLDENLLTTDDRASLFEILRYQLGASSVDVKVIHRSTLTTQDEAPVELLSYRRNQTSKRMLNWFYVPEESNDGR